MTAYQNHRKRWQNCRGCELCSQRSRVVLARGTVPCKVLFIGEAPGPSEDVIGKPFVGPAGKIFDRVLAEAVPASCSYAITNLVACFPREAKEAGINEPPKEAIEACAPRLQEFARLCKPRLIVAVGSLAAKHLPQWPNRPTTRAMIQILHPAAILRMQAVQRPLAIRRSIVTIADAVAEIV